ncbi:MAG: DUF3108 domain-containing protein [Geminicoccaceae bacterium]
MPCRWSRTSSSNTTRADDLRALRRAGVAAPLPATRRSLLLGLGLTLLAGAARAGCAAVPARDLGYAMRVGGVSVADLELRLRCSGDLASVQMVMRNSGLAALVSGSHRTDMTAEVTMGEAGPRPSRFSALYTKPDRTRETALVFAADGSLADLVVRHRGREQESPVPPALRQPSIDPLGALLELSDWLARAPAPDATMTLPIFDGRKRGDLETVYRGRGTIEVEGREREAHHLTAALRGLSGFEPDDAFVTLPGGPPSWIDVYASIEPMPMPLVIRSRDSTLETSIELVSG